MKNQIYITIKLKCLLEYSHSLINIIKKHGKGDNELKHTVCIADGVLKYLQDNWNEDSDLVPVNPFKKIKTSKLFKNFLGEGVANLKENEPVERLKITSSFMNTMGYEVLSAKLNQSNNTQNIEKHVYIENHADWFIMQSHGNDEYAALVIEDGTPPNFNVNAWRPDQLKINNPNLSFLILSACFVLDISQYALGPKTNTIKFIKSNGSDGVNNGIKWRKKMGEKVVLLGYSTEVTFFIMSESIFTLITYFESAPHLQYPYEDEIKNIVLNYWLKIHKDKIENAVKQLTPRIVNNTFFHSITYDLDMIHGVESACAIYKNYYYYLESLKPILDFYNENNPNVDSIEINKLDITAGL